MRKYVFRELSVDEFDSDDALDMLKCSCFEFELRTLFDPIQWNQILDDVRIADSLI